MSDVRRAQVELVAGAGVAYTADDLFVYTPPVLRVVNADWTEFERRRAARELLRVSRRAFEDGVTATMTERFGPGRLALRDWRRMAYRWVPDAADEPIIVGAVHRDD